MLLIDADSFEYLIEKPFRRAGDVLRLALFFWAGHLTDEDHFCGHRTAPEYQFLVLEFFLEGLINSGQFLGSCGWDRLHV